MISMTIEEFNAMPEYVPGTIDNLKTRCRLRGHIATSSNTLCYSIVSKPSIDPSEIAFSVEAIIIV
jgi:hypothetical protein